MPSVVAGTRLLDLLPLLNADYRVQVFFTRPEPSFLTSRTKAKYNSRSATLATMPSV